MNFSRVCAWALALLWVVFPPVLCQDEGAVRAEAPTDQSGVPPTSRQEQLFMQLRNGMVRLEPDMSTALQEIPFTITNVYLERVSVRAIEDGQAVSSDDMRVLGRFVEGKLKALFSKTKRFFLHSGKDLSTISLRLTDSTARLRNVMSEAEYQSYFRARNIHAAVSCEVVLSAATVTAFVTLSEPAGLSIWSREFSYTEPATRDISDQEQLMADFLPQRPTGLALHQASVAFARFPIHLSFSTANPPGDNFILLGYRYQEYATTFDWLSAMVDARLMYSIRQAASVFLVQPGFAYEVYGDKDAGRFAVSLDVLIGYMLSGSFSAGAYQAGVTARLSRNITCSLTWTVIEDAKAASSIYPVGRGALATFLYAF